MLCWSFLLFWFSYFLLSWFGGFFGESTYFFYCHCVVVIGGLWICFPPISFSFVVVIGDLDENVYARDDFDLLLANFFFDLARFDVLSSPTPFYFLSNLYFEFVLNCGWIIFWCLFGFMFAPIWIWIVTCNNGFFKIFKIFLKIWLNFVILSLKF